MTLQLCIFDFDGTLADTFPLFTESLQSLANSYHLKPLSPSEFEPLRGLSAREIIKELYIPFWYVPKLLTGFTDMIKQNIAQVRLFDDIPEVLQTLTERGMILALASSNSLANVEAVLGPELIQHFSVLECGASLFGKTHRIRRIMKRTGMSKVNTMYIGDEVRDAESARSAGVQFGAVAWGYTHFSTLQALQPDAAFKTPIDILTLVQTAR